MPRSFGNNYWLTPATKKRIAGDPAVQEMLNVALKQITKLNRANPKLAQKFYRTKLANGDELVVRTQFGKEFVYLYRGVTTEEEVGCEEYMESGRLTYIGFQINYAQFAKHSQLEYSDDVQNWIDANPSEPWVGKVEYVAD